MISLLKLQAKDGRVAEVAVMEAIEKTETGEAVKWDGNRRNTDDSQILSESECGDLHGKQVGRQGGHGGARRGRGCLDASRERGLHAAITGHLVLSTVHATDAVSALLRVRELGVDRSLVSTALIGVIGQRLVRGNSRCGVPEYRHHRKLCAEVYRHSCRRSYLQDGLRADARTAR